MKMFRNRLAICYLICCLLMMTVFPTADVLAKKKSRDCKDPDIVYYNQADYPGKKMGGSTIRAAGCAPTCIAVCYSSFKRKMVSVPKMCKKAYRKGWYITGEGCSHEVIPGLAKEYGLECKGLGQSRKAVKQALKKNHLVIALMGPGSFTKNGHFIVITGLSGKNKVTVADVGSRAHSSRVWSLKKIVKQSKEAADAGGPFWEISDPNHQLRGDAEKQEETALEKQQDILLDCEETVDVISKVAAH